MAFEDWKTIEPLGNGGQGTVYKARTAQRERELYQSKQRIAHIIKAASSISALAKDVDELATRIHELSSPDLLMHVGALKIFDLPDGGEERIKAIGRLQAEVRALTELRDPAILRILDAGPGSAKPYLVTEFHPEGPLTDHLSKFKGKPLEALLAFQPLVAAVHRIHEHGAVHRDIKTKNILVAIDGRLVLGDFGIVFFRDAHSDRLTEAQERVGTRDWMAPWAHRNLRLELERVNPKLDIFPLGKVLWSMIAGQDGFPAWDYDHRDNDLASRFPDDQAMSHINRILSRCIVRDEEDCMPSAAELHEMVVATIDTLKHIGVKPEGERPWPCRMCGKGRYEKGSHQVFQQYGTDNGAALGAYSLARYVCDHCGHVELFSEPQLSMSLQDDRPPSGGLTQDARDVLSGHNVYRDSIQLSGPSEIYLSIYPKGSRYLWTAKNKAVADLGALTLESVSYRTFDSTTRAFRPQREFRAPLGNLPNLLAGEESPERVFAQFPDGKFQFTGTANSAVPHWPNADSAPIRRWHFSFILKGLSEPWPIELLIQSLPDGSTLKFRPYREDIPVDEI